MKLYVWDIYRDKALINLRGSRHGGLSHIVILAEGMREAMALLQKMYPPEFSEIDYALLKRPTVDDLKSSKIMLMYNHIDDFNPAKEAIKKYMTPEWVNNITGGFQLQNGTKD